MCSTFPSLLQSNSLSSPGHLSSYSNFSKTCARPFEQQLTNDIVNPRVRELILRHKNIKSLLDQGSNRQAHRQHAEEIKSNEAFLKQFDERKWLTKKGKKYLIDFDNQERREMKHYFNSLDQKKCGSIGIDQLEELLLSVGLSETREQIKALIDSVDQDKSGKIQFGQFLSMIQNDEGQNEEIVSFFKTVLGGRIKSSPKNHQLIKNSQFNRQASKQIPKSSISQTLQKYPYPKGLSFQMVVSHIRRKHMMTALNIGKHSRKIDVSSTQSNIGQNTVEQIAKGQRVMQALQKMYERKLIRQIKQSKRNSKLNSLQQTQKKSASQPWILTKRSFN